MKDENINFFDEGLAGYTGDAIKDFLMLSKDKIGTNQGLEDDFKCCLFRQFQQIRVDRYGVWTHEKGYQIPIFCELLLNGAQEDWLGGTDLVLFQDIHNVYPKSKGIGIELKVFKTFKTFGKGKSYASYFIDGVMSEDEPSNDFKDRFNDGGFIKEIGDKSAITHCREGQLLKDYIKSNKILANDCNNVDVMYLIVFIISEKNVDFDLKDRITSLIKKLRESKNIIYTSSDKQLQLDGQYAYEYKDCGTVESEKYKIRSCGIKIKSPVAPV